MALTTGNVTIKTAAGTYSSWAGFWDDLGNLTGDITCTVDASAFTEDTALAAVTESLNGHTLHVLPASFPTSTDASTGARFALNYAPPFLYMEMEGAGTLIVEGIVATGGTPSPQVCYSFYGIITSFNVILRRNIMKGFAFGIRNRDVTLLGFKFYNNIIYDCSNTGISLAYDDSSAIIANNSIIDCKYNIEAGVHDLVIENCLAYSATTADYLNIATNVTGNNNADSDNTGEDADWATGANNVPGISDPFNNLAGDDFTITAEGDIGRAGKDLSGSFTTDFFGTTRSNWTIGACEYDSSQHITVGADATLEAEIEESLSLTTPIEAAVEAEIDIDLALQVSIEATVEAELEATKAIQIPIEALVEAEISSGNSTGAWVLIDASMDFSGSMSGQNPDWLLIPDYLNWKGNWNTLTSYGDRDVVLYKTDDGEYHGFVSKVTHNVGNIPTTSYAQWTRLIQGVWNK